MPFVKESDSSQAIIELFYVASVPFGKGSDSSPAIIELFYVASVIPQAITCESSVVGIPL